MTNAEIIQIEDILLELRGLFLYSKGEKKQENDLEFKPTTKQRMEYKNIMQSIVLKLKRKVFDLNSLVKVIIADARL